jgi:hypothetical protein
MQRCQIGVLFEDTINERGVRSYPARRDRSCLTTIAMSRLPLSSETKE